MGAYGLEERRATLARVKTINAGRAWQGSVTDDYVIPRDTAGRILPHAVIDFGAPVRSASDRSLAFSEARQPHILSLNVACVAGDYDSAQILAEAVFNLLLDWAPSGTADAYEAKGGYGSRRPSTSSTPTRFVEGLFFETTVNVDG